MIVTHKIVMDLGKKDLTSRLDVVQSDKYSRNLEFTLKANGAAWEIPDGVKAVVWYRKSDDTGGNYDTLPDGTQAYTISGNVLTVALAPQVCTVPGLVQLAVGLISGEAEITTFAVCINVQRNPGIDVVSENYYKVAGMLADSGWAPNRYLGTDADGNVVVKEGGTPGEPATLVSATVAYQAGESGTIIPSGSWSESIPTVAQGKYLWTKTEQQFNSGDPITAYSVTRMGVDGLGSVVSVAGVSPDSDGNVPLDAFDVKALPIGGGTMEGDINMDGKKLSGLNPPTEDTEAATKGYVDTKKAEANTYTDKQVKKAAPRNLLDNSDFTDPVNQRGAASYTNSGYTVDRWKTPSLNLAISLGDGCIVLENASTTAGYAFHQFIEIKRLISSKKYTLAICLDDGTIYCASDYALSENGSGTNNTFPGGGLQLTRSDAGHRFNINVNSGITLSLKWAALYEGEYTAETLPEYYPKGYGAELAECQRYYQIYSTDNIAAVDMRPTMRLSSPTITAVTGGYAYSADL